MPLKYHPAQTKNVSSIGNWEGHDDRDHETRIKIWKQTKVDKVSYDGI